MLSWLKRHLGWILGISILFAVCIFLLYAQLDMAVSLNYRDQTCEDQRREIEVLQRLLLNTGKRMRRSEIELLLAEELGEDGIDQEGPDELLIEGGIVLTFKGDSLQKVRSLNEYH